MSSAKLKPFTGNPVSPAAVEIPEDRQPFIKQALDNLNKSHNLQNQNILLQAELLKTQQTVAELHLQNEIFRSQIILGLSQDYNAIIESNRVYFVRQSQAVELQAVEQQVVKPLENVNSDSDSIS